MANFCSNCGTRLTPNANFCHECGQRVADAPAAPAVTPVAPPVEPIVVEDIYTLTKTMSEAAELAIQRNPTDDWAYWDDPKKFYDSAKSVRKFCEKEDRRNAGTPDHNGMLFYIVTKTGAIAHVYIGDDGEKQMEWIYYTHFDQPENLPMKPEELGL